MMWHATPSILAGICCNAATRIAEDDFDTITHGERVWQEAAASKSSRHSQGSNVSGDDETTGTQLESRHQQGAACAADLKAGHTASKRAELEEEFVGPHNGMEGTDGPRRKKDYEAATLEMEAASDILKAAIKTLEEAIMGASSVQCDLDCQARCHSGGADQLPGPRQLRVAATWR